LLLFYFVFLATESPYVAQAGLKLLDSSKESSCFSFPRS
jgi:hypothetical protein